MIATVGPVLFEEDDAFEIEQRVGEGDLATQGAGLFVERVALVLVVQRGVLGALGEFGERLAEGFHLKLLEQGLGAAQHHVQWVTIRGGNQRGLVRHLIADAGAPAAVRQLDLERLMLAAPLRLLVAGRGRPTAGAGQPAQGAEQHCRSLP